MPANTITPSSLDGLLAAILDTRHWIEEPAADRLERTLALDPNAARPHDLFEDANRSGWDEFRTKAARLLARLDDRECHDAVRRRADEVAFHMDRIVSLFGRCVDLPAPVVDEIRNLLRDGLMRNSTREALVGVVKDAGANTLEGTDEAAPAERAEEPSRATQSVAPRKWHCSEESDGSIVFGDGVDRGRIRARATTMVKIMRVLVAAGSRGIRWDDLRRQQKAESDGRYRSDAQTFARITRRLREDYFPVGMQWRLETDALGARLDTSDR